ncbi:MAG: LysR family transcriptional regulator [Planctomycetales bacterium]|nr:LysR family transcriptional regulator [Planctomycetales bacterium]
MQIRTLKIYCDVVDRRSFSRAAAENGISQGNASHLVQSLESHLGVLLLDRSTRPFELTAEGQRYYDGVRQLVQRYSELEEEVKTLHDAEARSLVVASIYSVGIHHMSAFMQRFSWAHPRAEVQLEYLHPHRVHEQVERGDADLGIVSYPKDCSELASIPWRSEPMVIVCAPAHRFAAERSLPLSALNGQPFVAFEAGLAIRDGIDAALQRCGAEVSVSLEFDNVETMKRAVEAGSGLSILPEPSVRREIAMGDLVKIAIEGEPLTRPLSIIHLRDRPLSQLAQQFVNELQADADFAEETSLVLGTRSLEFGSSHRERPKHRAR